MKPKLPKVSHFENENQEFVNKTNNLINSFITNNPCTTQLGPGLSLLSFQAAVKQLQLYRMAKNFEIPSKEHADDRASKSIQQMLDYDSNGLKLFSPVPLQIGYDMGPQFVTEMQPYTRHQLYNARKRLNEVISDYRFDIFSLEFPSGETFVSASGDISLYAKLRDRKQWCVTVECFDHFARVCYNTPMLKFAARRHFSMMSAEELAEMSSNDVLWRFEKARGSRHIGFEIFKYKLRRIVTFCDHARLTTVPKNNETDRVIMCELFCNMICQRVVEIGVRNVIKKHFGIDLSTSHLLHKALISQGDNATIDLRNASNSVWLKVVEWFIGGTKLYSDLYKTRSHTVKYAGKTHKLNMLSPMGNGFTFGLMTLLLLVISREYDSYAHVFGDDIIVDKHVAHDLIDLLSTIGMQTNEKKTFIEGPFKESCGGFVSHGQYITSFEFKYSLDVVDAVTTVNKVGLMSIAHQTELSPLLTKLHRDLIKITPAHLLRVGTLDESWALSKLKHELNSLALKNFRDKSGIYTDILDLKGDAFGLSNGVIAPLKVVVRRQKQCQWVSKQFVRKDSIYKNGFFIIQVIDPETRFVDVVSAKCTYQTVLQMTPTKKSKTYVRKSGKMLKPVHNVSRLFGWFYIWNGMVTAPALRDTKITFKREFMTLMS